MYFHSDDLRSQRVNETQDMQNRSEMFCEHVLCIHSPPPWSDCHQENLQVVLVVIPGMHGSQISRDTGNV